MIAFIKLRFGNYAIIGVFYVIKTYVMYGFDLIFAPSVTTQ